MLKFISEYLNSTSGTIVSIIIAVLPVLLSASAVVLMLNFKRRILRLFHRQEESFLHGQHYLQARQVDVEHLEFDFSQKRSEFMEAKGIVQKIRILEQIQLVSDRQLDLMFSVFLDAAEKNLNSAFENKVPEKILDIAKNCQDAIQRCRIEKDAVKKNALMEQILDYQEQFIMFLENSFSEEASK